MDRSDNNPDPRPHHRPRKEIAMETITEKLSLGIKKGRIADDLGVCRTTLWRRIREWRAQQAHLAGASECADDEAAS